MPFNSFRPFGWLFLLLFAYLPSAAQNLNGQRITVGADAPAFLIFNDEVVNAEFSTPEGTRLYSCKVRNNKSMSLTYKGDARQVPENIGLTVQEGKRNHYFIISFNKDYDINRDPSLWYDYSNLKELKKIAQRLSTTNKDDLAKLEQEEKEQAKKEEEKRQADVAKAQQTREQEADRIRRELKEMEKKDSKEQQELETKLIKAKEDEQKRNEEKKKAADEAKQKEAERLKIEALLKQETDQHKKDEETARKKQEEDRKKAELKAAEEKKAAELAARKKAEDDKKRAEEIARLKEADRIKAEAELKRKQEEDRKKAELQAQAEAKRKAEEEKKQQEIARKKQEEDARRAQAEAKRKEEERLLREAADKARLEEERRKKEHEEALARLKALEEEKERQRQEKAYTRAGLWERYGSKGINIFDIPDKQPQYVNSDFYLTTDTLRNYQYSMELLKAAPNLAINSQETVNGGVSMTLENIAFSGPNAYFRIHINNKSKEDFLMGAALVRWYNADETYRKPLRCSYVTFIQSFPIVRPGQDTRIVVVIRDANIQDGDILNINIGERRPDRKNMDIVFDGKVYNKERMKIEKKLTPDEPASADTNSKEKKGKRKKK
ncbi:hypothetical protein JMG10_19725 [Nostoc ellipsosporum NOK]|nr:hypothetical protein [Nostoc ellipsosporum NOK]